MTRHSTQRQSPSAIEDAAQDWFLLLSSGQATKSDIEAFHTWRDADPRHRSAFAEVRAIWNDLEGLETAFDVGLQSAAPTTGPAPERPHVPSRFEANGRRRVLAIAAMAACAALVAVFATDLPTTLRADHRTTVGQQAEVTLPDGSLASLNTNTAIRLAFSGDGRQVELLRGEAFFEVAKDASRPFSVLAVNGRVTATGTAFVVRDHGDAATVAVTEGSVAVVSPGKDTEPSVGLTAGQRVAYRDGARPGPVQQSAPGSAAIWREGTLAFEGLPMGDALAEIERYRPGRILLLTANKQGEPVTARLTLDTIEEGLQALADIHGLEVTRVTPYLTLLH